MRDWLLVSRAMPKQTVWPKTPAVLTADQRRIQDDWMRYWHEILPSRHGRIREFDNGYIVRTARPGDRTLEIGAGLGEHVRHESLASQDYHALELRPNMAEALQHEFPEIHTVVGDCQDRLPFDDACLDRVIAIHVLEHLPNLPAALDEIHRVLKPGGRLAVVIPCEGGLGYALGRRFTSQRLFEKRYGTSYDWHIKSDHVNTAAEILEELRARLRLADRHFFPLRVPSVHVNLTIGLTCVKG